jgi:diguanylate cyclase (GGDEF)-like protein
VNVPIPANEPERLAALREYHILDTNPEAAFEELTHLAGFVCGTPMTLVSLIDEKRQWFKSRVGLDVRETPRDQAFCAHAIMTNEPLIVTDAKQDARFATNPLVTGGPNIRFYAGVPLTNPAGHNLGTLCVIDRAPRALSGEQIEALRILGRQAMAQLELRKQARLLNLSIGEKIVVQEELRRSGEKLLALSITDELTGLHNRRAFNERLEEAIRLATRHAFPLSLLIIDVDQFKEYNRAFGQPAGDEVLKTLAATARETFRSTDFIARIGGEEFAVILPNTDADGGVRIAGRFRDVVQDCEWAQRSVTISAGVATRGPDRDDAFELISRADRALYRAKVNGRNSVLHATDLAKA